MCHHDFVTWEGVRFCRKCGLTILPDGKMMFDKGLLLKKWRKRNEKK